MVRYNIFMHLYDSYSDINSAMTNLINNNIYDSNNMCNYSYYKKFSITSIKKILSLYPNEYYIPSFRLILWGEKYNDYGLHRYGWAAVMNNFINSSYCENEQFYIDNKDFEWVSYAMTNNLETYEETLVHYNMHKLHYNKMKYIIFNDWLEKRYMWGHNINTYTDNFISFIHNPPCENEKLLGSNTYYENKKILEKNENFLKEKQYLKILITLSDHHKKYIENNIKLDKNTIIKNVFHPLESISTMFNINSIKPRLYMIGWWLRKYDIFLQLNYDKVIIMKSNEGLQVIQYVVNEINKALKNDNELSLLKTKYNTEIITTLNNNEYDKIFISNIIFLDLYDTVCNNVILECIMNCTPLLVYKHPSSVEYLGEAYPFYFTDINDAQEKLQNTKLIIDTHLYLKNMDKVKFTYKHFNNTVTQIINNILE